MIEVKTTLEKYFTYKLSGITVDCDGGNWITAADGTRLLNTSVNEWLNETMKGRWSIIDTSADAEYPSSVFRTILGFENVEDAAHFSLMFSEFLA